MFKWLNYLARTFFPLIFEVTLLSPVKFFSKCVLFLWSKLSYIWTPFLLDYFATSLLIPGGR